MTIKNIGISYNPNNNDNHTENMQYFKRKQFIANINKIENYDDIKVLICNNNKLRCLPELPQTLIFLKCSNNKLTYLPELSQTLKTLICHYNRLIYLPELPQTLYILACDHNKLIYLPELPKTLCHINYFSNNILIFPYYNSFANPNAYFSISRNGIKYIDIRYYLAPNSYKQYKDLSPSPHIMCQLPKLYKLLYI